MVEYMTITIEIAKKLLRDEEKLALKVYDDCGKPAIGYGHRLLPGENYKIITKEKAEELLDRDVNIAYNALKEHDISKLNHNQRAALISLIFNIGQSFYRSSTIRKLLIAGNIKEASDQFPRWCKAYNTEKKVLERNEGLYKRRLREMELYNKPILSEKGYDYLTEVLAHLGYYYDPTTKTKSKVDNIENIPFEFVKCDFNQYEKSITYTFKFGEKTYKLKGAEYRWREPSNLNNDVRNIIN